MKFNLNCLLLMLLLGAFSSCKTNKIQSYVPTDKALYEEILSMDKRYFDAYNSCDMETQSAIYADDIEFFHDRGGLMTSKTALLEAIKQNICGKVTRTLIPGSVEVYPIKNYGAVQIGFHKFFNNQEPDAISKPSKFVTIWQKENDGWKMAKVVSLH